MGTARAGWRRSCRQRRLERSCHVQRRARPSHEARSDEASGEPRSIVRWWRLLWVVTAGRSHGVVRLYVISLIDVAIAAADKTRGTRVITSSSWTAPVHVVGDHDPRGRSSLSAGKRDKGMDRERKLIVEIKTNFKQRLGPCPICGEEFEALPGLTVFEMSSDKPICESCVDRNGLALLRWFRDGARSAPLHR